MFFEKRHPSTHHERPGFCWNPGFRSPVSSCVLTWLDGRWGRLALRVHSPAASCSGPVRPARCRVFCLLLLATLPRGPEHRRAAGVEGTRGRSGEVRCLGSVAGQLRAPPTCPGRSSLGRGESGAASGAHPSSDQTGTLAVPAWGRGQGQGISP